MERGEPVRLILEVEALKEKELPHEYLQSMDKTFVYKSFTGGLFVCASGQFFEGVSNDLLITETINIGDKIPEQRFQEYIEICRVTGKRLADIKAKNREQYPEHAQGIHETIVI